MFKSKKRLLLIAAALLTVAGLGTAAVAVGGRFFDSESLVGQADAKPPASQDDGAEPAAHESGSPPQQGDGSEVVSPTGRLAPDSPGGRGPSNPEPRPMMPPTVYPAGGDAPIVRGNDDGSYRPSMPPLENNPSGGPSSPSSPSPPASAPGGSFGEPDNGSPSSQRFLPPTPAPMPVPVENETAAPIESSRLRRSSDSSPSYASAGLSDGGAAGTTTEDGYRASAAPGEAGDASSDRGAPTASTPAAPGRFESGYGRSLAPASPATTSPTGGAMSQTGGAGYGLAGNSSATGMEGRYDAATHVSSGGAAAAPGPKQLEGVQSPSLTIEKVAPAEIQVGRQTTFTIIVRNVGQVDAQEVVVFDQTPQGTRYIGSSPEAARAPDGSLMWQLGTLEPGEESTISLQLVPLQEGQIGSVARVAFAAQASASTICTKPLLTVEQSGPSSVLIGESINLTILISNPGTGVASGVMLEEDVPDGLAHAAGNELEYEVGELRPGESRKLELALTAEKPGLISNLLVVRGEGNLVAEDRLELEVVAPQLDVAVAGPSKRYLERQATYSVQVQNPGTASAKNIELVAYLPKGLKFVETDNQGQYDAQNHAVYWSLEELPPRVSGEVTLTTLPIETGQQKLRVEGRGDLGLSAAFDQEVMVEGLAELFFQVADAADPIEVGSETEYEIRVINQGSKTDTNVRVTARLPIGLTPISGDGPTRVLIQGQDVICEPLARLAPKDSAVYKIRVAGQRQGDHRISVQVVSDEVPTPVTKEESTRVYSDR